MPFRDAFKKLAEKDKKLKETIDRIDNKNQKYDSILNLFAQLPFLDDELATLLIIEYFGEKNNDFLYQYKLSSFLVNINPNFWVIRKDIKKSMKYEEFDFVKMSNILKNYIDNYGEVKYSKALNYMLIYSNILLHIESKTREVLSEFIQIIQDSNDDFHTVKIINYQLNSFFELGKDTKAEGIREAYFLKAKFLRQTRQFFKAKDYFNKVIEFPLKDELTAEAYQLLGHILYKEENNYKKAEEMLLTSIQLLTEDTYLKAKSYSILGNIYKKRNFNKAKEYFEKGLNIEMNLNNKIGQSKIIHDIGVLYIHHRQAKRYFSEARTYLQKSLKLKEDSSVNDVKGQAQVLLDLGILYTRVKENFKKAKEYFNKSLNIEEKLGNKRGQARVLYEMGRLYEKVEYDIKNAEFYYKKSLLLEEEINNEKGQKLVKQSLKKLGL